MGLQHEPQAAARIPGCCQRYLDELHIHTRLSQPTRLQHMVIVKCHQRCLGPYSAGAALSKKKILRFSAIVMGAS